MAMILSVYRDADGVDCTNGGITARFEKLLCMNVEGPFDFLVDRDGEKYAPVVLEIGNLPGTLVIRPAKMKFGQWVADGHGMMGGNYACTSDSRFSRACEKLLGHRFYGAVAVHDRFE